MNESKNLFQLIGDWWQVRSSTRPHGSQGYSQWLPSPGNILFTLLIAGLLIFTQQTWANNGPESVNVPGPSATTVNYQGRLAAPDGTPKNGTFGMSFAIYDAASGGNLIWGPESHNAVPVTNGLFNVGLGSLTSGGIPTTVWNGDRYLQITVGGEALTPRELLRSVPIAGMALTVPDRSITSNKLDLQNHFQRILAPVSVITNQVFGDGVLIPNTQMTINLDKPSRILFMGRGVAFYDYLNGENVIYLRVNGEGKQSHISKGASIDTFDITTFLDLPAGSHAIELRYTAQVSGATMTMQGWGDRSSLGYIVLDQN